MDIDPLSLILGMVGSVIFPFLRDRLEELYQFLKKTILRDILSITVPI
jgi:hypothetical protein